MTMTTTFGRLQLHGEALYNHSYSARDDSYISYVGGIDLTFNPTTDAESVS